MAAAKQKECPSCGAPLPVPKGASSVKCPYCSTVVEVQWTRTAPPPDAARPPTVYVSPGLPKAVVGIIVLAGLLPVAIPLLVFLGPMVQSAVVSRNLSFPVVCGLNQELDVVGYQFSGSGTLITAELNCKLHIKDSTLTGDVVVLGNVNAEITIENSTLEGKEAALKLDTNGHLHAKAGTLLKSPDTAVAGGTNLELDLEDAKVQGGSVGISGGTNTTVRAKRVEVQGDEVAIRLGSNGHVFGKSLALKSAGIGIEAGSSPEIAAEATTIDADVGVHGEGNGRITLTRKTRVTGATTGIEARDNLELSIEDSSVESDDTGVATKWNPHVHVTRGGRLHGKRIALQAGENLELDLKQGTLEGGETAICGKHNARIEARKSTIAGATALHFERKPETSLVDTTVTGAQTFDQRGCGAPPETARPLPPQAARTVPSPRPLPSPGKLPPAPIATVDPARPAPFDAGAAAAALDAAARAAGVRCRSSSGKPQKTWVTPGFAPDGQNRGAHVDDKLRGTPEAACVEAVFRAVRIPPFDPSTRPSGLMRAVDLR